jgi:4-amino-4-deoxy-L-arabinose transferase-like glycosyltransferase
MSNREQSQGVAGRAGEWLILAVFLAFLVGYAVLYFRTPIPGFAGTPPRYELLEARLLLPEQYVPNWFGSPPAVTLLDRLPILAYATAILTAAGLLGWVLLRLIRVRSRLTRLETFVFSMAVGVNALSLYVLIVGLIGDSKAQLPFYILGGGATAAAAAFWLNDRRRRSSLAATRGESGPAAPVQDGHESGPLEFSNDWLWLGAPFVLAIVLGGMLPPTDFDVREYHLEAPKEFYQAGKIYFLKHNVYGNMPLGSEMLSLLAMALMGDWWLGALVGKTVIASFAPMTALALLAAGRRFASPMAGVIAALVYISIPWISQVSTAGLVEGVSAFYLWTALYAVLLWRQRSAEKTGGLGLIVLAGFLTGAAVACKYPAALFVAVPLTAWVWLAGGRPNWKATGLFALACSVACAPWFIKNLALTGNPTYPLLYEIFHGATRTDIKNSQWVSAHLPHDYSWSSLVDKLSQVAWRSEWISPILVPLAALAWFVPGRRRTTLALFAFFAYVIAAWWLCTHRIDRFWIPALPVVAMLAGLGATWSSRPAWRGVLVTTLVCGLTVNWLFVVSIGPDGSNAYFRPLQPQLRYDTKRADFWHVYLNHAVPPGSWVLTVGDAQVFDLEMPVLYNTVFDDSYFEEIFMDHDRLRPAAEILAELKQRRISHVYVHWGEIRRYQQPGNYGFPRFIRLPLFEKLVKQGVFEQPLNRMFDYGQVYPVKGVNEVK